MSATKHLRFGVSLSVYFLYKHVGEVLLNIFNIVNGMLYFLHERSIGAFTAFPQIQLSHTFELNNTFFYLLKAYETS